MHLLVDYYASPVGVITLVSDQHGHLRALDFADYRERMERLLALHYGSYELEYAQAKAPSRTALDAYFAGDLRALDRVEVRTGGSPFQREVWRGLRAIPLGTTTSYGALAAQLGRPGSARAVGTANGQNPVAIVVPCHRVIGAQGSLVGYAGGLERKRWLLKHESTSLRTRPQGAHEQAVVTHAPFLAMRPPRERQGFTHGAQAAPVMGRSGPTQDTGAASAASRNVVRARVTCAGHW